ncbi:chitin disaccharide deacetylase [Brevibacillus choshinensis]|uniref:Carbohydrate deacetylase n=1 Tax=Brevibacillus choshinensis TaxID=54911 RepID=A0ABX7FP79_BRECH|nr:chitin disaccharide deacetylase [Brevibacillus choshinensis]QRG67553.1 chitin disaccharide deacetylase [Brevibacillus choshinensis]
MKLVVNADDFGYSKGVNLGILEAHVEGIVSSATMMMNMPGVAHAFRLAADTPTLGVGVHLVLTCGSPLEANVPTLTDENGMFRRGQAHLEDVSAEEVEREFTAQLETFFRSGRKPTHIDSHHHVHARETILPVVLRLAERHGLPVRYPWAFEQAAERSHTTKVHTTEGFSHHFYGADLTADGLIAIIEGLSGSATAEIMTHPAYVDEELLKGSSYAIPRARELQILTAPKVKEYIKLKKVQLVNFNEIG